MEKIDTDWKTTKLKRLAKLFKPFNRDWAPLMLLKFVVKDVSDKEKWCQRFKKK